VLNKVSISYRRLVSVSVSVSAETKNVVSSAVSVTAVTGKSGFGRSLKITFKDQSRLSIMVLVVKQIFSHRMSEQNVGTLKVLTSCLCSSESAIAADEVNELVTG